MANINQYRINIKQVIDHITWLPTRITGRTHLKPFEIRCGAFEIDSAHINISPITRLITKQTIITCAPHDDWSLYIPSFTLHRAELYTFDRWRASIESSENPPNV